MSAVEQERRGSRRRQSFDRTWGLWGVTVLVMLFLLLPVVVVFLFSFNSTKSLVIFDDWSLRWYRELLSDPTMVTSLRVSLLIAVLTAVISVVLGTMLAFGLLRAGRFVRRAGGGTVFLRLVTPETATAASLFLVFSQLKVTLNFWTILVGHVALCVAFVTVIVRSRLSAINAEIEDAAQDLGASRLGALWLVVLPPLRPTLLSAGLLAFVLSFDNFITTYFTAGVGDQPLPLRIYSMLRFGVTPEANAAGVVMFGVIAAVLTVAGIGFMTTRRLRARRPTTKGA